MTKTFQFDEFDCAFLDASAIWQQDPEIRELIDAAPFCREAQLRWHASLPGRSDYRIWGVSLDGKPVGAVGLKDIGESVAEYFGYLGDKSCWGMGLGSQLLAFAEQQARSLGVLLIRLRVLESNVRAIRLYQKQNYLYCMKPDSASRIMVKFLQPASNKES